MRIERERDKSIYTYIKTEREMGRVREKERDVERKPEIENKRDIYDRDIA